MHAKLTVFHMAGAFLSKISCINFALSFGNGTPDLR